MIENQKYFVYSECILLIVMKILTTLAKKMFAHLFTSVFIGNVSNPRFAVGIAITFCMNDSDL